MDLYFDSPATYGLRYYLRVVADEIGLTGESSYVQLEPPVHAYMAVEGRLKSFPARDVALLWDEEHGWAAGVETHSGEDLMVLTYLGKDVLPPPRTVARFARALTGDRLPGQTEPPAFRDHTDPDDLETRLAAYAGYNAAILRARSL
ncbi:hypothetical protein JOF56_007212 [Kibdelosporangium banguiense]|uniref:DUF6292 domain-containing protein n=1 Tax=Kibdelosporangium banguiense TaxID=1365924 RepID=A0ABS4TQZ1_9PSEU|nr:DUF6292 family protein [Kibdelosporangium banguiense]MBP2326827.1 hypothetical protein [Kibdelosporangium banguiense]